MSADTPVPGMTGTTSKSALLTRSDRQHFQCDGRSARHGSARIFPVARQTQSL